MDPGASASRAHVITAKTSHAESGAVASSNVGDGLVALAIPWLASLLTRDAMALAGVALATRLPWLVFSLQTGVLWDRFDRCRLMIVANSVRATVVGTAAALFLLDLMTLPVPSSASPCGCPSRSMPSPPRCRSP